MKEKIENILFAYKTGSMNISEAQQQVLDLFAVSKSVEPVGRVTVCDRCGKELKKGFCNNIRCSKDDYPY